VSIIFIRVGVAKGIFRNPLDQEKLFSKNSVSRVDRNIVLFIKLIPGKNASSAMTIDKIITFCGN
jgi:hypothetical protein